MKSAAIYCRVSTDRQKEEQTINAQIEELERYAAENDYIIVERYIDDGWSGDMLARPELDRMRDDASKKIWGFLLATDRDRIARRYSYQELILDELIEDEIEIVILHQARAETPEDRILQGVQGLFAEYERVKIAERMRRGKMHKVRKNLVMGNIAPYGYSYIPDTKEEPGHYVINETEAETVRQIFFWVAEEGLTIKRVIVRLNELGLKPRNGAKVTWASSQLSRMLRDETYIGTTYYNKTIAVPPKNPQVIGQYKKIKKSSRAIKPKEDWVPITVPVLVDSVIFEKVQKQVAANAALSKRNQKHNYLLSGLIWCECGQRRTGEGGNSPHNYYRCIDRILRFPLPRECKASGVDANVLDEAVWKRIVELLSNERLLSSQAKRWLVDKEAKTSRTMLEEIPRIKAELAKLDREESRYIKVYGEGLIRVDQFRSHVSSVRERKSVLENRLKEIDEIIRKRKESEITIEELVKAAPKAIESFGYPEKQALVQKAIERVVVGKDGQSVMVTGFIPAESEETNQNVEFESSSRNCRFAECR